MKRGMIVVTILVVGLLALAGAAWADPYIQVTADASHVIALSALGTRLPQYTSDWSGMSPATPVGSSTATAGNVHNGNMFHSGSGPYPSWIAWDLSAIYTVTSMHVWNYNEDGWVNQGINGFILQTASSTPVEFGGSGSWVNVETVDWSNSSYKGTASSAYPGFDYNNTDVTTQYIRFYNATNWAGGSNIGLSEVAFYGTVPEPATMALLALGGVGLLLKRRRT